jgi:tRNA A37 N6-isopentenylltransferase MiaA
LFVGPAQDAEIRAALTLEASVSGLRALYERLQRVDPSATSWIHPNDRQRIIRALEVYQLTGRPMSEWQKQHGFNEGPFETLKIGLYRDRAELYALIDERCDGMIEDGLVDEVKGLCAKGYSLIKTAAECGLQARWMVPSGADDFEGSRVFDEKRYAQTCQTTAHVVSQRQGDSLVSS